MSTGLLKAFNLRILAYLVMLSSYTSILSDIYDSG